MMKVTEEKIIGILILIVIAYLMFGKLASIFKNMFGSIGIGNTVSDDEREKEIAENEKKLTDVFNPHYWENGPKDKSAKLLPMADTLKICENIYDAIGYVYDNEEEVIAQFKKAKYKTQISWIALQFSNKYKKDLYAYLNDKLDTDKQREAFLNILSYVKGLPTGFFKP